MPINPSYLLVSDGTGDAALMHVTANRGIGGTIIEVDTIVGVPDKFIATSGTLLPSGLIDPTSITNFYGHLNGSNLEIDGFLAGSTDQGNSEGQVVVIKPNTFWANFIATFLQNVSNSDASALAAGVIGNTQLADGAVDGRVIAESAKTRIALSTSWWTDTTRTVSAGGLTPIPSQSKRAFTINHGGPLDISGTVTRMTLSAGTAYYGGIVYPAGSSTSVMAFETNLTNSSGTLTFRTLRATHPLTPGNYEIVPAFRGNGGSVSMPAYNGCDMQIVELGL